MRQDDILVDPIVKAVKHCFRCLLAWGITLVAGSLWVLGWTLAGLLSLVFVVVDRCWKPKWPLEGLEDAKDNSR